VNGVRRHADPIAGFDLTLLAPNLHQDATGENAAYFTLGGNVYPFEITLCDLVRSWSAPPRQPAAPRTEPW
jgi:hypothetical protein